MWKEFFEGLARLKQTGKPFVVATVVEVSGSTYRRPGARVLITEEGISTGLISGGCFESDLIERAKLVMDAQQPAVATFDTTSPDDLLFGLGLGCTGIAHILLQPVYPEQATPALDFLQSSVQNRKKGVLGTIFRNDQVPGLSIGSSIQITEHATQTNNIQNPSVVELLHHESLSVLTKQQSLVKTFALAGGTFEVLLEFVELPQQVLIFGAGPDAAPVARFAKELGWTVTVIDRRPAYARPDRFPDARVVLAEPEQVPSQLQLDESFAAVIMNHHFETDLKVLHLLLNSPLFYIGLLGPTSKTDLLFSKLREQGFEPSQEQLSRLFSPVGLDVGAETPEEIALSILSEIQAVKSGHSSGFLRNRTGPIHRR